MDTQMDKNSFEDVIDFAIDKEQEAVDFYNELARRSQNKPQMREIFTQFANEETAHKTRLQGIKRGWRPSPSGHDNIMNLKIIDYMVEGDPLMEMDYQRALIGAMKREKAAFRLYTDLAARTADIDTKNLFLALAQDEARHKLRFEVEYDDVILREN